MSIEMLKCLGDGATDFLGNVCQKICALGIWLEDFVKTVIIPFFVRLLFMLYVCSLLLPTFW